MQKWEYKIINEAFTQAKLNKIGQQGWQLCAVVYEPGEPTPYFYFKRPI
jgi:hypothetical protein